MGISIAEQETVINFGREDETVICWTSDSTWMTKMDNLVKKNSEEFKCTKEETIDGQVVQKRYEFPKKYVSIRSMTRKLNLTDEQIEARNKRLAEMRKKKKSSDLS